MDSVFVNYNGQRIINSDSISNSFETNTNIWFTLDGVIKGWTHGFTNFKGGDNITSNGPITYENSGKGVLFIPSGLAYANFGSTTILPNECLVFHIELHDFVKDTDHDNDGVASIFEDPDNDNNPKNEHKNLVDWICNYGFNKIQIAREEIIYNMPFFKTILPFVKLNPIGIKTKDNLNNKIVSSLNNQEVLDALCEGIFKSKDPNDTLNKMDYTLKLMKEHSNIFKKVTNAVKENIIQKDSVKNMINIAYEKKILSKSEYSKLNELYNAKKDVIEVDSFDSKIYKKQK